MTTAPPVLQRRATATACGRGHDIANARRDPKTGRIICRECEKERLEERGVRTTTFTMSVELVAALDMEAAELGVSRGTLLSAIVRRWLEDDGPEFTRDRALTDGRPR